jgi:hypothetical protein
MLAVSAEGRVKSEEWRRMLREAIARNFSGFRSAISTLHSAFTLWWKSGGPLIWKSGGGIEFCAECPCSGCSHCSDGVPSTYTVTIAGVSLETSCLPCIEDAAGAAMIVNSGTANGTYTLAYLGDNLPAYGDGNCVWQTTIPISMTIWGVVGGYPGGCDSNPYSYIAGTASMATITLVKGLRWSLIVAAVGQAVDFFLAEPLLVTTICETVAPFSNSLTSFVCGMEGAGAASLGIGGSATISTP